MSDVLEFAGVSVVRGDSTLLDNITWEVEEGQRWVILGPNGAGKTTLLQLAAGRIHPTTGVAGVLGEVLGAVDVEEIPPSFTDVLLMREGRIVAAGPLEMVLTGANLSRTFGIPLMVERHGDRWSARAAPNSPTKDLRAAGGSPAVRPGEQYGVGSRRWGGEPEGVGER